MNANRRFGVWSTPGFRRYVGNSLPPLRSCWAGLNGKSPPPSSHGIAALGDNILIERLSLTVGRHCRWQLTPTRLGADRYETIPMLRSDGRQGKNAKGAKNAKGVRGWQRYALVPFFPGRSRSWIRCIHRHKLLAFLAPWRFMLERSSPGTKEFRVFPTLCEALDRCSWPRRQYSGMLRWEMMVGRIGFDRHSRR
jgi:hypothetical protein